MPAGCRNVSQSSNLAPCQIEHGQLQQVRKQKSVMLVINEKEITKENNCIFTMGVIHVIYEIGYI